jgi:hypothetical protein
MLERSRIDPPASAKDGFQILLRSLYHSNAREHSQVEPSFF